MINRLSLHHLHQRDGMITVVHPQYIHTRRTHRVRSNRYNKDTLHCLLEMIITAALVTMDTVVIVTVHLILVINHQD